jgi:hypothetical protein
MCTNISLIPGYARGVNIMGQPASLVTGEGSSALQHGLKKLTKEARWGQERYENLVISTCRKVRRACKDLSKVFNVGDISTLQEDIKTQASSRN